MTMPSLRSSLRSSLLSVGVLAVAGTAGAMELDQAKGGLVVGADREPFDLFGRIELRNKSIDHGWVRSKEPVATGVLAGRFYGIGLRVEGDVAVGQDKQGTYLKNNGPVDMTSTATIQASHAKRYGSSDTKPGEVSRLSARLDFLFQINGVYDDGPFLQFLPYVRTETRPAESSGPLKEEQQWAGMDLWWALPIPGIELGLGNEFNLSSDYYAYRGAAGFREMYQIAPLDLQFWQMANWGDSNLSSFYTGNGQRGINYTQLGGKVLMPTPWVEWWMFSSVDWTYWLGSENRDILNANDIAKGDVTFSIGVEWIPLAQ